MRAIKVCGVGLLAHTSDFGCLVMAEGVHGDTIGLGLGLGLGRLPYNLRSGHNVFLLSQCLSTCIALGLAENERQ
jgi:hypothetical protein